MCIRAVPALAATMVDVRHLGSRTRRNDRIVGGVATLAFLATVTCAAVLLPDRVHLYYTPADRPDVVYELWQYLTLVVIGAGIMVVAFGAVGSAFAALAMAFNPGKPNGDASVASWVGAWTLLWLSAEVWLAIWLGNDQPVRRSWWELLVALSGLAGASFILGWRVWVVARRGTDDQVFLR